MEFLGTIIEMRSGGVAIECEQALAEVIAGVRRTGKRGKLTLEVEVTPADKGRLDIDTVFLVDRIKAEVPQLDKKKTIFFINKQGQLTRDNERQTNIFEEVREEEVTR